MGTGFGPGLNSVVDSRAVLGTLLAAAVTAGAGLAWRRWHQPREITWRVLYDERINQGTDLWTIRHQNATIRDGSLVMLEVRNSGSQAITPELLQPA